MWPRRPDIQSGKAFGSVFSLSLNSGGAGTLEGLSSQANQLTSATIYKKHTCVIDTDALMAEACQPPLPLTPTASEARLRGTRAREEHLWEGSSARGCSGFQRRPWQQSWRSCCSCSSGPNPAQKCPEGMSLLGHLWSTHTDALPAWRLLT